MLSAETLLQQRFQNKRPGLQLVAIEGAALPVTVISGDVLAQERKNFPLLPEFVLRLADAGVLRTNEVAKFLGVESSLVESAIAEQVSADNLSYRTPSRGIQLTTRGKNSVRDLESIQPVRAQIAVVFDRLVWSIADYPRGQLVTKKEALDRGMLLLPPLKTSRIALDDVTAADINSMLRKREGKSLRREVLIVEQVRASSHRYFPIKLLVFGDVERGEVELVPVIDGDSSVRHDRALSEAGGAVRLGIRVEHSPDRPILSSELESIRIPRDEVEFLRSATINERMAAADREAVAIADPNPASDEEISLSQAPVRSVSVFEHRELLTEALETATRRILLISPWIKSAVVDATFVARLRRRLKEGVQVTIAYGIGDSDKGCDENAIRQLERLSDTYSKVFSFVRLKNTHAKVLIYDDRWISTSFNWLSFLGDPERTYRMEEGTLVQIPTQVNAQYQYYLGLIEEHRRL